MKISNLLIFIIFSISSCKSIDSETVCLNFVSERLSIKLPRHHILKNELYEEGIIYYIYLNDGYMIITEGANMKFPLDNLSSSIRSKKGHIYQSSINDNSYWRKESLGRIRVYCLSYQKKKYDIKQLNRICNSIKILPKGDFAIFDGFKEEHSAKKNTK